MILRSISLWIVLGVSGVVGVALADILDNPIRVYVESPDAIQRSYEKAGGTLPRVYGWAIYNSVPPGIRNCQVHVPPLSPETMWVWQHEFRHCIDGKFHR